MAVARDTFHGIMLTARDDEGPRVADQLLADALVEP